MKNKIIKVLFELGMPADIKGFGYIVDFVMLLNDDEYKNAKVLELYKKVGDINGVNLSKVERCIRHAFSTVLINGNKDAIKKYFPDSKHSNANLLKTLSFKLLMEENTNE